MSHDLNYDQRDLISGGPDPYRRMAEEQLLRIFGEELKHLLTSRSATERVLLDQDPKRRFGALRLLSLYWKPNPLLEEVYRRLALTDVDADVRVEALIYWSFLYTGSRDVAFSKALARLIADETNTPKFRTYAYFALCSVQLIACPSKLDVYKSLVYKKDHLPAELDWEIVNKFL